MHRSSSTGADSIGRRRAPRATRSGLLVALSFALLATPVAAQAQEAPLAEREAEAKAYFLSGVELLKTGKVEAALEQFLRSRAAFPRGKNTINAAICLERLGRFDEALVLYEELQSRRAGELEGEDRDALGPIIKNLSGKVGSVSVSANVDGAAVQVDGKPRETIDTPLRLLPGRHVVRVVADGYSTFTTPVEIRVGETAKVVASLERLTRVGVLRVEDPESEGADVFVDQVLVGQIPWEGVVSAGPHVVLQRRGDKGSRPSAATVVQGQTSLVKLRAEVLGPGVSLSVEPSSARLSLDGVEVGSGSWEGRLPRGTYRVRAEEPGYFAKEASLELAGDPAELRLKLAIDEAHARWPKAPRGDFFVGAFLGAGFSGGLGSGAELTCPSHCTENNPAFGYLVGARVGYRFPTGTAIEALGGYGAATTSVLREVRDSFTAGGVDQSVRYRLSESVDLTFPFVGVGLSQRAPLIGPLSLLGRLSGGVAFARATPTIQADARTTGSPVPAFVDGSDPSTGALPFFQPEVGVELSVDKLRFSGGLGFLVLAGLLPSYGTRALVVDSDPDMSDPGAVGNAPYSSAIADERSAGLAWLFTPQVGATYAF